MRSGNAPQLRLSIVLWVMAAHSFLVGTFLMIQLPKVMALTGFFLSHEKFFAAQGGAFHVVMAVGYSLAALNSRRYRCLIEFSIFVKAAATVFLFSYYVFVDHKWIVLASGLGDGIFLVILWLSFISYDRLLKK